MPTDPRRDLTNFVEFDWDTYFQDFDQYHGGDPVVYGETRLLYRDGWMYSLTDSAGPEWKPAKEEKVKFQIEYWETRKAETRKEYQWLQQRLKALSSFQEARSLPLKVFTYVQNEETGQKRRETIDLNLDMIQERIYWLYQNEEECIEMLNELDHNFLVGNSNNAR